jgi:serine/threonine protein kinase
MSPSPGDIVDGKYRIVRLIGDGGMGAVYEARHELLGVQVALKFLHSDLAKRPGLAARFLQEARVSATIRSPHVAHVTDVDTAPDGSPYLVMELLAGESLQALLGRRGKLSMSDAIDFATQILTGLEAAHALGVVHRDLKPDNVFVTPGSDGPLLKLIDFGIAKLRESSEYKKEVTRAGVMMGTPEYMAPEQLYAAHEVDHRADLYSLGVMLFEMLSGARPADGDSAEAIVTSTIAGKVKRLATLEPNLPAPLVAVVERALSADREQRFASAREMKLELAHALGAPRGDADTGPGLPPTASDAPGDALPDTVDAPRLGIAKTLPPEAGIAPRAATGTQAAQLPMGPVIMPNRGPVIQRRRRSGSGGKWALGLGLVFVALGAAAVVSWQLFSQPTRIIPDLPAPDPLPTSSGVGPISIAPIASAGPDIVPRTPPATPGRATPNTPAPPTATTPKPGTTPATPSSTPPIPGLPLPFPSFALPSSLPPLPSTLPPGFPTALPSFFPQIPGLTSPPTPQAASSAR